MEWSSYGTVGHQRRLHPGWVTKERFWTLQSAGQCSLYLLNLSKTFLSPSAIDQSLLLKISLTFTTYVTGMNFHPSNFRWHVMNKEYKKKKRKTFIPPSLLLKACLTCTTYVIGNYLQPFVSRWHVINKQHKKTKSCSRNFLERSDSVSHIKNM